MALDISMVPFPGTIQTKKSSYIKHLQANSRLYPKLYPKTRTPFTSWSIED